MMHDAEALAQRRRKHAGARGRTHEGEALERQFNSLRVCAAIDDEVDLVILHRRIEKLFDDTPQAMNLVDEEDVALFQGRQNTDEIFGFLQRRTAGGA